MELIIRECIKKFTTLTFILLYYVEPSVSVHGLLRNNLSSRCEQLNRDVLRALYVFAPVTHVGDLLLFVHALLIVRVKQQVGEISHTHNTGAIGGDDSCSHARG